MQALRCLRTSSRHVALRPVLPCIRILPASSIWICTSTSRSFSTSPSLLKEETKPSSITLLSETYPTDTFTNIPPTLPPFLTRHLHLQPSHPLSTTRQLLSSLFPPSQFTSYTPENPIVTTHQNFDSLSFPLDHPGRSKSDTYYINSTTCLRTHTSAHQCEKFAELAAGDPSGSGEGKTGYLITADVYRRDAIDRSHYPVFHQMEGAKLWSRKAPGNENGVQDEVMQHLNDLSKPDVEVVETCELHHPERNPVQLENGHTVKEAEAVALNLQRHLEILASAVFREARLAREAAGDPVAKGEEKLQVRWVEAYFPFTSPSYELEVLWGGEWLEVLGCGVIRQDLLNNSGCEDRVGWAFGLGLERIAMVMFGIPDIRLFWSGDERFLGQFKEGKVGRFVGFSRYPGCYKDVAFWVGEEDVHENDFMEVVRGVGGDLVEDVKLIDEFTHPKTGRKSLCYRINYRSLERTLTNEEIDVYQEKVRTAIVDKLGVEVR